MEDDPAGAGATGCSLGNTDADSYIDFHADPDTDNYADFHADSDAHGYP
jgi:hypothetical protein